MKESLSFMPEGRRVPRLWMRRISCRLQLSLLPEMGQRARIFISETQWLPEVKCLARRLVLSWLMTDLRCSPNLILNDFQFLQYKEKHIYYMRCSR